jgi:hypothetical protein
MATATPLLIQVTDGRVVKAEASVVVAQPGPLVATKLQALRPTAVSDSLTRSGGRPIDLDRLALVGELLMASMR